MIKKRISVLKNRLTTVGEEEPLNKLSLAIIILLDLFILNILFYGLADHTKQITSPNEYMPGVAREVFIDQTWSPSVRLSKLQPLVLSDRNNYHYRQDSIFEKERLKRMHPLCRNFHEKIKNLSEDKELPELFVLRNRKTDERDKLIRSHDQTKRAYDTQLLETIAGEADSSSRAIAKRSEGLTVRIEQLTRDISGIEKQINAHPVVQELWGIVDPGSGKRQQAVDDFRRFERWYPLKELGWQLVFILPIFGIFYAWSTRSVKKENRIQILVSSHLLVVASLPIFFKVIEVVVDLIPNHFFKNLFKILKSLNLIAVWHYLVIIGAVALGLFLVFLIQKKVFNQSRTMQKRLAKGTCIRCGKKLPAGTSVCPFCGTGQQKPCTSCQKPTPVAGTYCIHCGTKTLGP